MEKLEHLQTVQCLLDLSAQSKRPPGWLAHESRLRLIDSSLATLMLKIAGIVPSALADFISDWKDFRQLYQSQRDEPLENDQKAAFRRAIRFFSEQLRY